MAVVASSLDQHLGALQRSYVRACALAADTPTPAVLQLLAAVTNELAALTTTTSSSSVSSSSSSLGFRRGAARGAARALSLSCDGHALALALEPLLVSGAPRRVDADAECIVCLRPLAATHATGTDRLAAFVPSARHACALVHVGGCLSCLARVLAVRAHCPLCAEPVSEDDLRVYAPAV